MKRSSWLHFCRPRWFIVAAIAGTLLNLINQYQAIVLGTVDMDYPRLALTYAVPYLVSSFSAWFERPKEANNFL